MNAVFEKSLTTKTMPCDLNKAHAEIFYPTSKNWNQIVIKGNVTTKHDILQEILKEDGFVSKNRKNIIRAPVYINALNAIIKLTVTF